MQVRVWLAPSEMDCVHPVPQGGEEVQDQEVLDRFTKLVEVPDPAPLQQETEVHEHDTPEHSEGGHRVAKRSVPRGSHK